LLTSESSQDGSQELEIKRNHYESDSKSAALRSSDLSRQVGAAIFTEDGELITQGCNEVPKAHGGTYWDLETPDHRDIKKGYDPNDRQKKEIVRDLVERLRKKNYFRVPFRGSVNPSPLGDGMQ
jgi:cytidine deaminase